jgi:DNA polymerase
MLSAQPNVVVLLGATAAQSLPGSTFRLAADRGEARHLPAAPSLTGRHQHYREILEALNR